MKLTETVSYGGCAAKVGFGQLRDLLSSLAVNDSSFAAPTNIDDAAVLPQSSSERMVWTVDFIPPLCDDPSIYAQIAVANALSDIYAMGGRPMGCLAVLGIDPRVSTSTFDALMLSAQSFLAGVDCPILGGHTIYSQGAFFGLTVLGKLNEIAFETSNANPGDYIFLSKPIGTGTFTTAKKHMKIAVTQSDPEVQSMITLNDKAMLLARKAKSICATDVTGFGLLGHLSNICHASSVSAKIDCEAIPRFTETEGYFSGGHVTSGSRRNRQALENCAAFTDLQTLHQELLFDPQTSGGLLIVTPNEIPEYEKIGQILERGDQMFYF